MTDVSPRQLASLREIAGRYADVFDAVDSLQQAGLRRSLIPKLVVVGDQSSGKSSVLEAICQVPFPVDEDLCTRFPTEVVQRMADEESVTISISVVGMRTNSDTLARFLQKISPIDPKRLAVAIQEASSLILSNPASSTGRCRFSNDILRITVSGPQRYPITLVDLPGLFSSSTASQDQEDRVIVDKMVKAYVREPRNALLLVVSARSPYTLLKAPKEVAERGADFLGLRTLGIVTTPDTPYGPQEVLRRFSTDGPWNPYHGWHCLRNRTRDERIHGFDRDDVEAAYFNDHWEEIDDACKGIVALRPKLTNLLASQIQRHLRSLIKEVKSQIKSLRGQLEDLQRKKTSEQQQRDYLARMAGEFQLLCCNAINGQYGEGTVPARLQAFFNESRDSQQRSQDKRLQAVVRAMCQLFNSVMIEKGKLTEILQHDSGEDPEQQCPIPSSPGSSSSERPDHPTCSQEDVEEDDIPGSHTAREAAADDEERNDGTSEEAEKEEYSEGVHEDEHGEEGEEGYDEEEEEEMGEHSSRESVSRGDSDDKDPFQASRTTKQPRKGGPLGVNEKAEIPRESRDNAEHDSPLLSASKILRPDVLEDYESFPPTVQTDFESFEGKVLELATRWRGTESLVEVNPAMVSQLFRGETSRWRAISSRHVQLVMEAVNRFVHLALEHCIEPSLLQDLKRLIVNERLERLRLSAERKLEELLQCHEGMNPSFHDFTSHFGGVSFKLGGGTTSTKEDTEKVLWRHIKSFLTTEMLERALGMAFFNVRDSMPEAKVVNIIAKKMKGIIGVAAIDSLGHGGVRKGRSQPTDEQAAVRRAISTMEKDYKISLVSFATYVNALVIHNGLLEKIPYEILTYEIVSQQDAKTISDIAGEKEHDSQRRSDCEKKLGVLTNALAAFEEFRNQGS